MIFITGGKAIIRRVGVDVTILTIGPSLYPSLDVPSNYHQLE